MRPTGIVRKVDSLGRVVVPTELRRIFGMEVGTPMEILTDDDGIILRKYQSANACIVTGVVSDDNYALAEGKVILSKAGLKQLLAEVEEDE